MGFVLLAGRRAVLEALRAGKRRVECVWCLQGGKGEILGEIAGLAEARGVRVLEVSRREMDALARGAEHRGVLARATTTESSSLEDLLAVPAERGESALLVALDEVKDPQNVGAIIRTAEGAGAHGLFMTEHRTAPLGDGVRRASAGAVEHLEVARVTNLRGALEKCKEAGCWVLGADAAGEQEYTETELTKPVVIVLGEEGKGLRDLTRKTCDALVRIPLLGRTASLNVSAAAAAILFEAARQRRIERGASTHLK